MGCMTHIRRKFVEAERACPGVASKALEYIGLLIPRRKILESARPRTKKCQKPERRKDSLSWMPWRHG